MSWRKGVLVGSIALTMGLILLTSTLNFFLDTLNKEDVNSSYLIQVNLTADETLSTLSFLPPGWKNSKLIPEIVSIIVLSFSGLQILVSFLLCIVTKWSYQRLVAVCWIGAHLFVFTASVLLFLFVLFIQSSQQREKIAQLLVVDEYRTSGVTNMVENERKKILTPSSFFNDAAGHLFCACLIANAIFILVNTIFAVQLIVTRPRMREQQYILVQS